MSGYRERRDAQLELEKKRNAELEVLNAQMKAENLKMKKAAIKLQTAFRGWLSRNIDMPRQRERIRIEKKWSLRNIFRFYTSRQCEV